VSALRLRLPAGLAAAAACCLVLAAPAQAETVTASCDTPPAQRDTCNRWYTTAPVSLSWQWDPGGTPSSCNPLVLTAEGRVERTCRVQWSGTSTTKTVWIGIDRTRPQVLAPAPSRPPDFNGWYNHPVDFAFRGTDLASGVASCSRATYGGPDGAGVRVGGICRDKVGHVGAGSFAINYDATPPPAPVARAVPGNRRVKLSWSSTPGTLAQVVRIRGSRARLVYVGPSSRFTDRRLRNGRRYRWLVSLVDQAGNRAADLTSAVPTSSPLLTPADGAHLRNPPLLVWKGARRVRYFNVQLVRRGRKILSRWPAAPQLQLHRSWRFGGRRHRLVRGLYCWYVWPGRGAPSERRYRKVLGKSCFRMVSRRTTAL
jgi:hypothetical protein